MTKDFKVRLCVKICIKTRMNEKIKTVPEDIIKECSLNNHVYDYLREFEKEDLIEVERDNNDNKYIDIRLSERGLQDLNEVMLAPYNKNIRNLILKMDDNSAPKIEVDENLIDFLLSFKREISSFVRESMIQMFGTVIPNDFDFSPNIEKFFDNKFDNEFVNLNDISQK